MGSPKDITQYLAVSKTKRGSKHTRVRNGFLYVTYIVFVALMLSQFYFCFIL